MQPEMCTHAASTHITTLTASHPGIRDKPQTTTAVAVALRAHRRLAAGRRPSAAPDRPRFLNLPTPNIPTLASPALLCLSISCLRGGQTPMPLAHAKPNARCGGRPGTTLYTTSEGCVGGGGRLDLPGSVCDGNGLASSTTDVAFRDNREFSLGTREHSSITNPRVRVRTRTLVISTPSRESRVLGKEMRLCFWFGTQSLFRQQAFSPVFHISIPNNLSASIFFGSTQERNRLVPYLKATVVSLL